jgi:sentrin-specific protease 1
MDRDMTLHSKDDHHQRSHFFNSFFIEKLFHSNKEYHYQNVQRWTKKFDIFSMKRIFFPINISNTHWTLAVIHMNKKRIDYYDSMSGSGRLYVTGLLRWLKDEAKAKKNMDLNVSEWTVHDGNDIIQLGQAHSDDELIGNVPQQLNGSDCGVFTVICADFLSDDLPLSYSQNDMQFFRRKIAADIVRGSLLYPV